MRWGIATTAAAACLSLCPASLAAVVVPQQRVGQPIRQQQQQQHQTLQRAVRPRQISDDAGRAAAVVEAFRFAWNGYYTNAFPNDELKPVTNGATNSRNGWGASAVDALSTALIMGEESIVDQILIHINGINYTRTGTSEPSEVSLFETTIRYLGGMISGYDLLKGPLANLTSNATLVDRLLEQSVSLADTMKYAFNTTSGVPANGLLIEQQTTDNSQTNGLATVGTLILEWTRLADLTGNREYAQLVDRAESYLLNPQPAGAEPFPGLVGTNIDIATGQFVDNRGGWSGGTDSFYEYLLKMYLYDQSRYSLLRDRWIAAADSTIRNLTTHPTSRPDLTYVAEYAGTTLRLQSGHLTCFHGGNFLLGGAVLQRQDYIDYGLELVEGCRNTYTSTATKIGPERFSWNQTAVPAEQQQFFAQNGFFITAADYQLRPEVVESYYYAWRVTADPKYKEWVWEAFVAVNATTRVGSGFSSVTDVNAAQGGQKTDFQESFFFAEVLKYMYLTFSSQDAPWQIGNGGRNEWVYSTEAHPVKVQGTPV